MLKLNVKAVASAFAALALTMVMSWTLIDATSLARVHRDSNASGFVTAVSALVR